MTTTFPSERCLSLYDPNPTGGLERYTTIWRNFIHGAEIPLGHSHYVLGGERVKEYNGTIVNDTIVFASEADKAWFILRWS